MSQEGQEPYEPPQAESQPGGIEPDKDARTWAMLCHISALSSFISIPGFIPPLVIWLIKKDEYPFVDDQGKESLNFQISMLIYGLVSAALVCVVVGIFLLIAVGLFDLIMVIVATVQVNNGVRYRYPLCIRLIK